MVETITTSVSSSACSKVLITGAYLIIDPIYSGLVLATDARFHCTSSLSQLKSSDCIFKIQVQSSQFSLSLDFNILYGGIVKAASLGMNTFIHKCVLYLVACL